MKHLKTLFEISMMFLIIISCSKEDPNTVPDSPVIREVVPGNAMVKIAFTAPMDNGGSEIIRYTATSMPDNIIGVLEEVEKDTIVVTGLINDKEYTFTVTATNAVGTSAASEVSNAVTPTAKEWHYNCYPVYDNWGYYLYDDCYWEYY